MSKWALWQPDPVIRLAGWRPTRTAKLMIAILDTITIFVLCDLVLVLHMWAG